METRAQLSPAAGGFDTCTCQGTEAHDANAARVSFWACGGSTLSEPTYETALCYAYECVRRQYGSTSSSPGRLLLAKKKRALQPLISEETWGGKLLLTKRALGRAVMHRDASDVNHEQ